MLGIAISPTDVFYTEDRDYVVWLQALVDMAYRTQSKGR